MSNSFLMNKLSVKAHLSLHMLWFLQRVWKQNVEQNKLFPS